MSEDISFLILYSVVFIMSVVGLICAIIFIEIPEYKGNNEKAIESRKGLKGVLIGSSCLLIIVSFILGYSEIKDLLKERSEKKISQLI